eukprot:scaffold1403_cov241-Pinguiococcus_pyrenoidosus.AAC.5
MKLVIALLVALVASASAFAPAGGRAKTSTALNAFSFGPKKAAPKVRGPSPLKSRGPGGSKSPYEARGGFESRVAACGGPGR